MKQDNTRFDDWLNNNESRLKEEFTSGNEGDFMDFCLDRFEEETGEFSELTQIINKTESYSEMRGETKNDKQND